MKFLIIGLMVLKSFSSFAADTSSERPVKGILFSEVELCRKDDKIELHMIYDYSNVISKYTLVFSDDRKWIEEKFLKEIDESCEDATTVIGNKSNDNKSIDVLAIQLK